jgi:hypothetical protein
MGHPSRLIVYVVASALVLVHSVSAQIGGGSIVGSVVDNSDAAIVGASVTATNVATNEVARTVTNNVGYFEFPILPAGRYVLETQAQGFERAKTSEFSLNSGTRPRFDLKMVVGQVTESIEVQAIAPIVNATTADLGIVVDQAKVEGLPLNGRDFQQLVGLQAGVYSNPDTFNGQRGGIEFNGASAYGNNLLMDGVDMSFGENSGGANDKSAGTEVGRAAGNATGNGIGRGSLINTISVEAIQEFKATGSAFSAEYGRATGGVLNVTTKSGTNQFHGTLFEFFRNDKLDANAFFSNRASLAKPPLRWNQFGANLGGPIRRDKLFFFFNYEGARASQNSPQSGTVPTDLLLSMVTPAQRKELSLLPPATTATSNPLVGLNFHNDARTNNENTFVSRGDAELGKQRLSLRYNYNHQDFTTPNLIPTNPSIFPTRFHNAEIADTASISSSMVNELRIGFNRLDEFRHDAAFLTTPAFMNVSDLGLSIAMDHLKFDSDSYTLADNFTVIHGNHTWKTGFEIRNLRTHRFDYTQPSTTYLTTAHLLADTPDSISVNLNAFRNLRNVDYGFFIQDNWRFSKRFQVNAGLRYEYFTPATGAWNVKTRDPFGPYIANKGDPMYQPDYTDFSPRLGLIFDVFGDQKLVIRVGGALTYNPPQLVNMYDMIFTADPRLGGAGAFAAADVPAGVNLKFPFDPSFVTQYIANPSLLPASFHVARSLVDNNRRDERSGTWNFSVQHAFTPHLAFQASYVGTRNWDQYGTRNLNLFDTRLGIRPLHPELGAVTLREYAGRSSYHALQLSANQRLQHGVTLDFYYTYAKSLAYYGADSSNSGDATVQDANNIAGSYGPKISDIRNFETIVASYAMPVGFAGKSRLATAFLSGWNIQGIQTARSGLPINVLAGRDEAGINTSGFQRPDAVPGVNQYIENLTSMQWLNPLAFDNKTPASQFRYGNLGFDALRGPSLLTFDFALHKTFRVYEKQTLTFRAEAFNVLNHKKLNLPVTSLANPAFGQILSGGDGRNVQLALKYLF